MRNLEKLLSRTMVIYQLEEIQDSNEEPGISSHNQLTPVPCQCKLMENDIWEADIKTFIWSN